MIPFIDGDVNKHLPPSSFLLYCCADEGYTTEGPDIMYAWTMDHT